MHIRVIILSIYPCVHTCTRSSWMALYMCHVCAASSCLSLSHTQAHAHTYIYRHTYPLTHPQLVSAEYMTLTIQLQSSEHSSPTAAVGITTQQPDNNVVILTSTEAL